MFHSDDIDYIVTMKILLLENISTVAINLLKSTGHEVVAFKTNIEDQLVVKELHNTEIIGLRSRSQITKEIIEQCPNLKAIGCFCIGTNQVDIKHAQIKGIPVFNAPFSNTRSVAEMVIAEIIILCRNIHTRNAELHRNVWNKMANGSNEVRGKTLGIVGYGRIGSQLGILAEGLGMNVLYYDIERKLSLGNAIECSSLNELLSKSDIVSLHVPQTAQTKNMISQKELLTMKKGSKLVNASRGNVIVIEDLVSALQSEHIASVAIDVFPQEPKNNSEPFQSPLSQFDNALLTPHIGGSTIEAQENIGTEVGEKLIKYVSLGSTIGSVNFPESSLQRAKGSILRISHIHKNTPGILEKINNIFAKNNVNISAQILQTEGEVGYALIDVPHAVDEHTMQELLSIPNTIDARIIRF
ncbi:MAG: D-3-phosphoglycerate dehydrogenase [Candidatus Deianiraeaceae bacterium]|jgi:D-3-phosphoglycerate dehydrogenase